MKAKKIAKKLEKMPAMRELRTSDICLCSDLPDCLNDLSQEAHTVGFNMGLWDHVREPKDLCEEIFKGLNLFLDGRRVDGKGYFVEKGKPCGQAIPLAGIVLALADYFAGQGWDFGGAVKAQLEWKDKTSRSKTFGGRSK